MAVVQALRWCADYLNAIASDQASLNPGVPFGAQVQIEALLRATDEEPLRSAAASAPTRPELVALRREGYPWGSVAKVADLLLAADKSTEFLLWELLMPDDEIRWRLFHLAVFGQVLASFESHGCRVTSRRPLTAASERPAYEVTAPNGDDYSVWFEASGVWKHLNRNSPYHEASRGMARVDRANGADILILGPNDRVLILECKYSWSANWVARQGYYQAMAYAAEARSRLVGGNEPMRAEAAFARPAPTVWSYVIGPEGVVPMVSHTDVFVGRVGTAPPSALEALMSAFLGGPPVETADPVTQ